VTPERYAQAKGVFLQAVALDPARRGDFLAQACAGDEPLRREVESLLAHHDPQTILSAATVDVPRSQRAGAAPGAGGTAPPQDTGALRIGRAAATASGALFSYLFGSARRKAIAVAVACVAVVGLAWLVHGLIYRAMQAKLEQELSTLLAAEVEALKLWFASQRSNAQTTAADPAVRRLIARLAETAGRGPAGTAALLAAAELSELRTQLQPVLQEQGYQGFVVFDAQRRIIAALEDTLIGDTRLAAGADALAPAFGQAPVAAMVLPFASLMPLPDVDGQYRSGVPTMFALAPVRDENQKVMAALALRILPERDFTRILNVARAGQTGETYAFDRSGRLLSESRFDDQLKRAGLIPDLPDSRSILLVELRDPGADLTRGRRAVQRRSEQPLTRMAAAAITGQSGVDVAGYRDYRGVSVVGAWTWLDDYQLGVATEIDAREAFAPLRYLTVIVGAVFSLLTVAVIATLWSSFFVVRLRCAVVEAQQLGQYTLEQKIGEGGMGQVYLARHALLKRPTAVKVLAPSRSTPQAIARFEREVQLASQLTHPNTIEIYDFGRTPEGIFYYAMEYLPGITLDQLVRLEGALPPSRAVCILRQVCAALQEAHEIGLIHRDIKPQNIMLCERGGECDFVKVLDFGLVKPVGDPGAPQITAGFQISGTPLYMAPEMLREPQNADARADIYALGVVGFHLLTGRDPFEAADLIELFHQVATADRPRPSQHAREPIPPRLDQLILECLAKDPAHRPASVAEMLVVLDSDLGLAPWTKDRARQWWSQRPGGLPSTPGGSARHGLETTSSADTHERPRVAESRSCQDGH
jgi:serine/threonine protein kinase